jgi:hypothetical protein
LGVLPAGHAKHKINSHSVKQCRGFASWLVVESIWGGSTQRFVRSNRLAFWPYENSYFSRVTRFSHDEAGRKPNNKREIRHSLANTVEIDYHTDYFLGVDCIEALLCQEQAWHAIFAPKNFKFWSVVSLNLVIVFFVFIA